MNSNTTDELSIVDMKSENPLDATMRMGKIRNIEV